MSYQAHYTGEFEVTPPMSPEHLELFTRVLKGGDNDVFQPLPTELAEIAERFDWMESDLTADQKPTAYGWDVAGEASWNFDEDSFKKLLDVFFASRGYKVTGSMYWNGDGDDDSGTVFVKDNQVEFVADEIENPGPSWDPRPTLDGMRKALEGVLHHNESTKKKYKLPESLIRHIKTALKVS